MKTVNGYWVNFRTIGLLGAGLLGVATPIHAETLSTKALPIGNLTTEPLTTENLAVSPDYRLSQAIQIAAETPKPPTEFLPTTIPISPALQPRKFDTVTPTPPKSESLDLKVDTTRTIAPPKTAPSTIAPSTTVPAGTVPPKISPLMAKPKLPGVDRSAPAPEALYTPSNPLLFPTKPSEVTVKGAYPLTLTQTLELAERNNRDLEVSRLQIEQQKAVVREAQAGLFPTLDLQSVFTRSRSAGGTIGIRSAQAEAIARAGGNEQTARQQDVFTGGQTFRRNVADDSTSWDSSIQVNYDLYTSGSGAARRKSAAGRLRASELAMERVREQLRLDATGDYYDLQEADEQVRINTKAVQNSQQSLRDTQLQERVGLGTRFDVLRSEVQLANNQQQLTNSQANQTIRRRQISQRLSLPEYVTVIAGDEVKKESIWKPSLEQTIVLAYKGRVELEEQLVQRDISESDRKLALSALGPKIQLRASYDLQKIFEQPVSGLAGGYSLSAVAQWRVFDGGAARAQADQRAIDGKIAEVRFTQTRNTVRFQVEQAYANQISNDKNIDTTSTALFQASEALRLAKLRFQAGVGTQTDVINAETDLTRAEGNRVTAILGYNRAIAQLRRFISNVAPE